MCIYFYKLYTHNLYIYIYILYNPTASVAQLDVSQRLVQGIAHRFTGPFSTNGSPAATLFVGLLLTGAFAEWQLPSRFRG